MRRLCVVLDGVECMVDPGTVCVTSGSSELVAEPVDSPRLSERTRGRLSRAASLLSGRVDGIAICHDLDAARLHVANHPRGRGGAGIRRRLARVLVKALSQVEGGATFASCSSAPLPQDLFWTSPSDLPWTSPRRGGAQ